MSDEVHVSLCMGSSCFARGNKQLLDNLEELIRANGWEHRVRLSGMRCRDLCAGGPNVAIDGRLHQGLDAGAILDILLDRLGTAATASPERE